MTGVEWVALGAGAVVVEVVFALAVGRWLQSCREAWAELDASVAAAIAAHPTSPVPVADEATGDPAPVLERTDVAQAGFARQVASVPGNDWGRGERVRRAAALERLAADERQKPAVRRKAQERLLAELRAEHDLLRSRDDWAAKTIHRVLPDPSVLKGER